MRNLSVLSLSLCLCAFFGLSACQAPATRGTTAGREIDVGREVAPPSSQYDVGPKLLRGRAPVYPIKQLLRGGSGKAVIDFTVDEKGFPKDFRIVSSDYPYFAAHAIIAMRDWRFQPALKNGKPVSVRVRLPFHYVTH